MSQTKAQLIDPVDGSLVNADINASAAIAGTKISPDFGSQNITTTGIVKIADGSVSAPALAFTDDLDTGIFSVSQNTINFTTAGVERLEMGTSLTVFNEDGADVDFRIEGDSRQFLFYVDAGNDRIGIDRTAPDALLHIFDSPDHGNDRAAFKVEAFRPKIRLQDRSSSSHSAEILCNSNALRFNVSVPSDDTTNLTERLRIDSSGNLGIGTTSPSSKVDIHCGTDNTGLQITSTDAGAFASYFDNTGASTIGHSGTDLVLSCDPAGSVGSSNIVFQVDSNNERMRLDSSGRLLLGHTASLAGASGGNAFNLQVVGNNFSSSGVNQQRYENSISGASLILAHSRGSIGNHTILQTNDELGKIRFYGSDGNDFANYGAEINVAVDASPGNNVMPGRMTFATTTSGGSTPAERMRIDSQGRVKIHGVDATITDHAVGVTQAPLYLQVATDLTAVSTSEGGATKGLFRIFDAGSSNNRYHGIELRNRNSGDFRILCKDVGTTDQGQLILALPSSGGGCKAKLIMDSATNSFKISGRDASELLDGSAIESTDLYIATASTITSPIDGAGNNRSGIVRIHDRGSNDNRFIGFEARNRNSGDVRFLNADLGATNKADAVIVCDNGSAAFENARFLNTGGIAFNGDTSTSNALDDYEEGIFSIGVTDSNNTFTTGQESGRYIKIGHVVHCTFTINCTISGTSGFAFFLTGFPFTVKNYGSHANEGLGTCKGTGQEIQLEAQQDNTTVKARNPSSGSAMSVNDVGCTNNTVKSVRGYIIYQTT